MDTQRKLCFAEIAAAEHRLKPFISQTPLLRSDYLSARIGGNIFLKLENLQRLASFKIRGMVNRVLVMSPEEMSKGVLVVSSGNHAMAASWCGRKWGFPVTVYIPVTTPEYKVRRIRELGADVRLAGEDFNEATSIMRRETGAGTDDCQQVHVDSSCDVDVVMGYGSIGREIARQGRDMDAEMDSVLIPFGGGGLACGVGIAVKHLLPNAKVYAVQTAECPALIASLRDGVCHEDYPAGDSICESLVGGISPLPFENAGRYMDEAVLTSEDTIRQAFRVLLAHDKVLAEPSAVVGIAYVLEHPEEFANKNSAIVVSGGNIGFPLLAKEVSELVVSTILRQEEFRR